MSLKTILPESANRSRAAKGQFWYLTLQSPPLSISYIVIS